MVQFMMAEWSIPLRLLAVSVIRRARDRRRACASIRFSSMATMCIGWRGRASEGGRNVIVKRSPIGRDRRRDAAGLQRPHARA